MFCQWLGCFLYTKEVFGTLSDGKSHYRYARTNGQHFVKMFVKLVVPEKNEIKKVNYQYNYEKNK